MKMRSRAVPAAGIAFAVLALCASAAVRAQGRSPSSRVAPADLSGVNSMIRDLRAKVTSLEKENDLLKAQLADVEKKVGVLDGKARAQHAAPATRRKAVKDSVLSGHFASLAEFRNKVLAVMKPELDPMRASLAALDQHAHTFEKASYGYATLATVQYCNGCLIPYVAPEKAGKAAVVETSGPIAK